MSFLVGLEDSNRYFGSFPIVLPHPLLLNRNVFPSLAVGFGIGLNQSNAFNPVSTTIILELGMWLNEMWRKMAGRRGGLGERSASWCWPLSWIHKAHAALEWGHQISSLYYTEWQNESWSVMTLLSQWPETYLKPTIPMDSEIHKPVNSLYSLSLLSWGFC